MALVRAVTELRDSSGLTNQELVERADMSASYYYARLRGDAPFDTNDDGSISSADAPTGGKKVGAALGGTTILTTTSSARFTAQNISDCTRRSGPSSCIPSQSPNEHRILDQSQLLQS